MQWAGHVTHREEMRNAYKILVKKSEGIDHLDLCIHGGIILKWTLQK
jgi:hypothetical protein